MDDKKDSYSDGVFTAVLLCLAAGIIAIVSYVAGWHVSCDHALTALRLAKQPEALSAVQQVGCGTGK